MLASNSFRAINCGSVTLGGQTGAFFSEEFFNIDVTIVDRVHQVRGRSAGHSAADWAVIDNNNRSIFARGDIGRSHTSDACADHAHIHCDVLLKRRG